MAGTPDDIRKERFRAKWDASGLAAKIDFEASDPDLVQEDDIVSEGSLNDTRDSVVSTIWKGKKAIFRKKVPHSHKTHFLKAFLARCVILGDNVGFI